MYRKTVITATYKQGAPLKKKILQEFLSPGIALHTLLKFSMTKWITYFYAYMFDVPQKIQRKI